MTNLNLFNSFGDFDKSWIKEFTEYYMNEFDSNKFRNLSYQLDNFIIYNRSSDKMFFNLKGLSDLDKVLMKSKLHQTCPLVYFLIKLTLFFMLLLLVKQIFSSMKYIKNKLAIV